MVKIYFIRADEKVQANYEVFDKSKLNLSQKADKAAAFVNSEAILLELNKLFATPKKVAYVMEDLSVLSLNKVINSIEKNFPTSKFEFNSLINREVIKLK